MLFLIRILAGKLNEAWEFFRVSFFGTALSETYVSKLSGKPAEAMMSLKHYFSSRNSAHLIRNHFAFRYSPEDLDKVLAYMAEQLDL